MVASITPFVWGMKAEVESAEEAVKVIGQGVWWEGKKYKVELWRNARARALAGEGANKAPVGPRGGGPLNGPLGGTGEWQGYQPTFGTSNVRCYNCQQFGHFARTCTIRSRMMSNWIGNGGTKRPSGVQGQRNGAPTGPGGQGVGGYGNIGWGNPRSGSGGMNALW